MADAKTLKQEQTALFRYAVIFPLLDERLGQGDQARILDEISAKDYEIPFSTRRKVSRGTAARWLTLYRKGGIDALHPRGRQDKGESRTIDTELLNSLLATKREHPDWTVTAVVRKVEEAEGTRIPVHSVYRAFRQYDFLVEDHRIQPKQTTYFNQTKYHRFQPKYGRVQSKYDYFLIFGNLGVVPKSTCVTILFFPL